MKIIAGEKSNNCLEGCRLPAYDSYLYLQNINSYRLEGAEMEEHKCFKCGTTEGTIIKHHIKYNPEEIVDCCRSCHQKIHIRLRKEGECLIPSEELKNIRNLCESVKQKHDAKRRIYDKTYRYRFSFGFTVGSNARIWEYIIFNTKTGNVLVKSQFRGNNKNKLYSIREVNHERRN